MLLVDIDRIASNVGKSRLLDDGIVPFSHHAPIDFCNGVTPPGPSREETWRVEARFHLPRLLAVEYLSLYTMWRGESAIKCVVVDLDDTLWPGIAGEGGFAPTSEDAIGSLRYGVYGGIHQALKILKHRGVLLATCSKNNADDLEPIWDGLRVACVEGMRYLLQRDDFVMHKVNWRRKSDNVREIMQALGPRSTP